MCQFTWVALTKAKDGVAETTEAYLSSHHSESWKSKIKVLIELAPSSALREGPVQASLLHEEGHLMPVSSHHLPLYVFVFKFPLIGTSLIGDQPHPNNLILI